jgi:nucleoside-diphosphate-sugar epimerase
MSTEQRVLITGATGNLGDKLRRHLEGQYELVLIDRQGRGDPAVVEADLAVWDEWDAHFDEVDTVFHLAADPTAQQPWPAVVGPNIDALIHVYQAALEHNVRRVVYASSNHVMGGYKDRAEPWRITTDLPPLPGTRYVVEGEQRDSTPYAAAKLFGERLGYCLAEAHGMEVVAVRLGWVRPGDNRARDIPADRGEWFQQMWLSNRDFCQLMERCMLAYLADPFVIVHGMSNNTGMRWDLDATRDLIGYEPQDDVTRAKTGPP